VGTFGVENVGGPLVRPTSESAGKTRYISTTTFDMLLVDAPDGISPVKAAPVISVCCVSTKSSPVSISNFPGLSGRVAVAMRPSGLPVPAPKCSVRSRRLHNFQAGDGGRPWTVARRRSWPPDSRSFSDAGRPLGEVDENRTDQASAPVP
jgi:hypothetical protein